MQAIRTQDQSGQSQDFEPYPEQMISTGAAEDILLFESDESDDSWPLRTDLNGTGQAVTIDHLGTRDSPEPEPPSKFNEAVIALESKGWPTSPKPIRSPWWMTAWNYFFDLLLFASALTFLTFAAAVSKYDHAPVMDNPRATGLLLNATTYGPTVFPILFALIIGRATHIILRWRLERGEKIGVLDTLAASTSLTSTLVSQFQLRTLSTFGIILVAVWALSPIGGQASLRQMTIGTSNATHHASFDYLTHSGNGAGFLDTSSLSFWQIVNSIFNSAVVGSATSKLSPIDNWGNVKIPRIEDYEEQATSDEEHWYTVKAVRSEAYTSLIGIPMSGTDSMDFVNYRTCLHTSYLQTVCSLAPYEISPDMSDGNLTHPGMKSFVGPGAIIQFDDAAQKLRPYTDPSKLAPLPFQYLTRSWAADNYRLFCNLTTIYVEVEVTCPLSTSCRATKIRRSQLESPPPAWTPFDLAGTNQPVIFGRLLGSAPNKNRTPTMLDKFLSDPDSAAQNFPLSVPQTSVENYSSRLGQLMNSYFTIMNGIYTIAGGLNNHTAYFRNQNMTFVPPENSKNSTLYRPDEVLWYQAPNNPGVKGKVWTAEGTKSTSSRVIIAHKPWVATLCIASVVLIFGALVSPVAHFFLIRGPEVMMNISSLSTRHNSYLSLPEKGTHLDAADRALLLKELRVRFGDADEGSDVGHLVIGAFHELAGIRGGRLYN